MEFQNGLTEFVSRLTRRLDREPISENRDSLIGAALLGKAIAIEAIQLTNDDVTAESMMESVPKAIEHLLSLGLRTFQESDAPWETAINECRLTLATTAEVLKENQFSEPGANQSADFRELVSSRIKMLSQNHTVLVEVNGVNAETIVPSVPYAIYQFARINKRLIAHASSELGWLALSVGRHTSALRRTEWREQTEEGEYDTGIPWTKSDPYSPE
jgi:hypothetical protein